MNVKELKQLLSLLPDDANILMENHHQECHAITDPKIRIDKKLGLILILPESYQI